MGPIPCVSGVFPTQHCLEVGVQSELSRSLPTDLTGTDSLTGFVLVLAVSLFWHPFLSPINLSRSSVAGAAIFF